MNLPPKTDSFPKFFSRLFLIKDLKGVTLYPRIFLKSEIYEDLQKAKPNPQSLAVQAHEREHLKRQKEIGLIKFFVKYFLFPRFRFEEEMIAYKKFAEILKENKIPCDSALFAKHLSGHQYFWCVSYKRAKEELDKLT